LELGAKYQEEEKGCERNNSYRKGLPTGTLRLPWRVPWTG
jgi:hypothetical protein